MTLEQFMEEWNSPSGTMLVHTSGSTGKPKPVEVEKKRMLASARMTCDFLGLKPGDTALLCMPLDYIAGKMMVVRSLEHGMRLLSVNPSNHPLAGVSEHVDFAAMVPSQVYSSLQVPSERRKLSGIGHLIIGGGAVPERLESELQELGSEIWSTYGMTETLSHIAMRRIGDPWYLPFENVSVSLDSDGCLVIDAPSVHDGLLRTNDIAELDTDGRRFKIRGRRDNVICCGGIKLQIEEIEEKLRPLISGPFCITKRPDAKFGEVSVLVMETAQEVDYSSLDKYMRPKDVVIAPVPVTGTGKVNRAEAQALFQTR